MPVVEEAVQPQAWDPELALNVSPVATQVPVPLQTQKEWSAAEIDAYNGRPGNGSMTLEVR